ncbi:MAG: hypothetical protein PVI00_12660 [Desulfobacterales bacterium]|jgi:hypothetical protein
MGFAMAAKKTPHKSNKKESSKEDRRSHVDRRQFSYTEYIPERRSNEDRRKRGQEEDNTE